MSDGAGSEGGSGLAVSVVAAVKRYGGTRALDGVDLQVEPGEFLVLLGPSGSGKSTLVRCLAGIERLDDGELRLGGRLASGHRTHRPPEARDLAMVFQDYALWPHLTVRENVAYALRRRHLPAAERDRRVDAVLDQVDLTRHRDRFPHEMSGGEQQRVALARSVVARPGLLLFDEPLSNLDADLRERLRVEISTLTRRSGATAVYITHDQAEAFALADRMAVLSGGRVLQHGRPEEIYRNPATPFVARFTGHAAQLQATVQARDGRLVLLAAGDHQLAARPVGDLGPGDAVQLLLRPAASSLVPGPRPGEPTRRGELPGIVVDVAYRGRCYELVVQTPLGLITAIQHAAPQARGGRVVVGLDPDSCLAYRDDGRTDAPPAAMLDLREPRIPSPAP